MRKCITLGATLCYSRGDGRKNFRRTSTKSACLGILTTYGSFLSSRLSNLPRLVRRSTLLGVVAISFAPPSRRLLLLLLFVIGSFTLGPVSLGKPHPLIPISRRTRWIYHRLGWIEIWCCLSYHPLVPIRNIPGVRSARLWCRGA